MRMRWSVLGMLIFLGIVLLCVGGEAQGINRAGLVVRFGDGTVITRCIEFTEDAITGEDVLKRSGLRVILDYSSGMGGAVCKIEDEGCDYPQVPCFCQCMGGGECIYWAYFHLKNGAWEYSGTGCSNYYVHNGDVEGWAWGPGSPTGGTQPPVIPFEQICPASASSPTPTA
ncbi:MAG TPA: hypothetical protein ENG33_02465, partial [Chloroflexi bacterium]|nr:hypothetical protein [Chloroflexota bacterium]